MGYAEGSYRVGPLARAERCARVGTPEAEKQLTVLQQAAGGKPVEGSLYYHHARLIEILFGIERVEALLGNLDICGHDLIAESHELLPEGIGVIERPAEPSSTITPSTNAEESPPSISSSRPARTTTP